MKFKLPWQRIQLINACKEFASLQLWDRFDNLDLFVVDTPLEDPVVCSIMGNGGQEYGLCVFRGPKAFEQPFLISRGPAAFAKQAHTIGFSMDHYRNMHPEEKKWFKSCNYRARKDDWLPSFVLQQPNRGVVPLKDDADVKLLLHVLKGILEAHYQGKFEPRGVGQAEADMLTIQTRGKSDNPDVTVIHQSFEGSAELVDYCNSDVMVGDFDLTDLSGLERLDQTWVLVSDFIRVKGQELCVLAIAEESNRYVLHTDIVSEDIFDVLDFLAGVFGGDNASETIGIPKSIVIADIELFEAIGDKLSELGIAIRCRVDHPVATDIRHSLKHDLPGLSRLMGDGFFEDDEIDLSIVPADGDLDGWKAVSRSQAMRFFEYWKRTDALRKNRPGRKFFADVDWEYYLDAYQDMMVLPSYVTWAALCYRSRKTSPTQAETLLGEATLPKALGVMLESLNASYPSLYQITETDPEAGTLGLKDLLLGGQMTVHDYGLSDSAKTGWIVPLWTCRAGNFTFVDVAGPMFGALDAMDILEELRDGKLPAEPDTKWLRENAHIFGRLWQLFDDLHSELDDPGNLGPNLVNSDGEPLEMIFAQFGYSNGASVRKALKRRKDFDFDKEADTYIWFKDAGGDHPMERTLLGRVYFEDGFVKAEVNSQGRLDRLRKLLEEIGLVYHTHNSQGLADMLETVEQMEPAKLSNDDGGPEELPDNMNQAVQQNLSAYYMDWLDQPIPAFDGKTPRQAAKTKKGAQQVRIMIETIPTMMGDAEVHIPKQAMMEELGL